MWKLQGRYLSKINLGNTATPPFGDKKTVALIPEIDIFLLILTAYIPYFSKSSPSRINSPLEIFQFPKSKVMSPFLEKMSKILKIQILKKFYNKI